ncbi:MAG TPA: fluoride efflux transporter CrcB [Rhodobacteraceae bacterium]|nr:fluoride efflux transporter CrcB [Paracoccaceae bacterium]
MPIILQVALGGAIGASLRYASNGMALRLLGSGFPYGTMLVNILGSFLMGLAAFYMLERMDGSFARFAPFILTGVLGGFTTFSAFSLDAVFLIERSRYLAAAIYMGGSVALAMLALIAGMALARSLT